MSEDPPTIQTPKTAEELRGLVETHPESFHPALMPHINSFFERNGLEPLDTVSEEIIDTRSIRERHPDWPPIKLHFYFSEHHSAADVERVPELLESSDIYMVELGDEDSKKSLNFLQNVAFADPTKSPPGAIEKLRDSTTGTYKTIIPALFGSGKIIGSIDSPPAELSLVTKVHQAYDGLHLDKLAEFDDFDSFLAGYQEKIKNVATLQRERDLLMSARLEKEIEFLLDTHPDLRQKPQLRVLLALGSLHTGVYHDLRQTKDELGIDISREMIQYPYTFGYLNQAIRHYMLSAGEVSPDLLKRAFIDQVIGQAISAILGNESRDESKSNDSLVYGRNIAGKLDLEMAESFFRSLKSGNLTIDRINYFLASSGLPELPRDGKVLEGMMSQNS